jgi:predicted small lipoprotein YifL
MKLIRTLYSMAALIMLVSLLTACGLGKPVGTPVPAGATVEVGGWSNATTTMEGYDINLVVSAGMNNSGWQVTMLGANSSAGGIRLDLEIKNNMETPGAIDLIKGPTLIDQQGSKTLPSMVNLGTSDSIPIHSSGNITDSVACSFSAPDINGIQAAACDLILVVPDGKVLLAVGAGKTVQVSIAFLTPTAASGLVMEWQDGTRFAVP